MAVALCKALADSQHGGDYPAAVKLTLAALGSILQVLCEDIHMLQIHDKAD